MGRRTVLMLVAILVAALGSTLVFLYVQGINDRAIADQEPVKVLTATDTITPGESIDDAMSSGKLALTEVPKANVLPEAMTTTEALQGQLALTTIYQGEQILPAKFGASSSIDTLTYPKGTIATSVQLTDFDRVAGFVQPGSHVAIFVCVDKVASKDAKSDDASADVTCEGVQLLLSNVEVIGVGSTSLITTTTKTEDGSQTTEELPKAILTVALDLEDTKKLVLARKNQDLTFALMNDDSAVGNGAPVWYDSVFK